MSEDELKPKASWVIGRAQDCDLVLAEAQVSSHHCRLTHEADGFLLEDLGSTNGTFVNGARIAPREPVHVPHGARVTLGGQTPMPWPVASAGPAEVLGPAGGFHHPAVAHPAHGGVVDALAFGVEGED